MPLVGIGWGRTLLWITGVLGALQEETKTLLALLGQMVKGHSGLIPLADGTYKAIQLTV